jgi:GMP synthase-like glutamine amidotransferase
MILIVNVCSEALHYFEFVRPVEDVLRRENIYFQTFHYKQVNEALLKKAEKVIICGTSLRDNKFLDDIEEFVWLKKFKKPVFGICAGFQIVARVFEQRIYSKQEVGFFYEKFSKDFFDLSGEVEVYHLHNNYAVFDRRKFDIYSEGEIVQAIRKKRKNIYGCLFHPEVRNRDVILNFVKRKF